MILSPSKCSVKMSPEEINVYLVTDTEDMIAGSYPVLLEVMASYHGTWDQAGQR